MWRWRGEKAKAIQVGAMEFLILAGQVWAWLEAGQVGRWIVRNEVWAAHLLAKALQSGGRINFSCKSRTICSPVVDEPTRNFTAEEPDEILFLGLYFPFPGEPGWPPNPGPNPPPSYCEAPTQEAADQCATQPPFPNGSAPQLFFSVASTCTVNCADETTATFTSPTGLFYSPTSQAQADALSFQFACEAANSFCGTPKPRNTEQTCEILCPDGSTASYTTPAGSFMGDTQEAANAQAYAFSCSVASLLCDGDPPPEIFTNVPQSCTTICPDGTSVTVTVPAGTTIALSQFEANESAHSLACALAVLGCTNIPPLICNTQQSCSQSCDGVTVTYTVPAGVFCTMSQLTSNQMAFVYACAVLNVSCVDGDPPPPPPTVGNTPQSCSASCGSGTFSVTIGRNQFRLENLAAANAAAQSYACTLASNHRTCLGDIATSVCQNSAYADSIPITGDAPSSWSVSGTLPPGITFLAGSIMGVATGLGDYSFQVTARTPFGDAVRSYQISVVGILTSALAPGEVNVPYSGAIVQVGMVNPTFSIQGGVLPSGLVLNPSTGIVSGTPTVAGSYSFVVQIEG